MKAARVVHVLQTLFDYYPRPLLLVEPESFAVATGNRAAAAASRRPVESLRGAPLTDVLPAEDVVRIREAVASSTAPMTVVELDPDQPVGLPRQMDVVRIDAAGETPYAPLVFLAERAPGRAQPFELVRDVQLQMDALRRSCAGMIHDVNNLLSVIGTCAELARTEVGRDSSAHEDLLEIARTVERGRQMTRQLLDAARGAASAHEPIRVNQLIEEIAPHLRRLLGPSVALTLSLDPQSPTIVGNRTQMEQMLVNLVINARDATVGTGDVTIDTRAVLLGPSPGSGMRRGHYTVIGVTDVGTGMDEATLSRIFEPFFTTKGAAGTGLGLTSVAEIVARHSGRIVVHSQQGQGSTFQIFLPNADQYGLRG